MTVSCRRLMLLGAALLLLTQTGCSPARRAAAEQGSAALSGSRASVTVRAPDAFYEPPADRPIRSGVLLRAEALKNDVTLPPGMQAWRILYTTSVDDRTPATAVAMVFAPTHLPSGPRPVITWEHGTTGVMQKCMPSLLSAPTEGIPARDRIVAQGWVVVATDYSFVEGDGPHPYIIGEGEARAALDAVRAARQMRELELDSRTVVWGHSQGGHAALWTGMIGPRYAPEVQIVGVAGIAPAADMKNILALNPEVEKRLGPYLAFSYSRFYPEISFDQALRPSALQAGREIARLCGFLPLEDPRRISELTSSFDGPAMATGSNARLAARLAQNTAAGPIESPLLIAQGLSDEVVLPAATNAYVAQRCAAGQPLEYWTLEGLNHGSIVQPGTPLDQPLVEWTAKRFARQDAAPASGCSRRSM